MLQLKKTILSLLCLTAVMAAGCSDNKNTDSQIVTETSSEIQTTIPQETKPDITAYNYVKSPQEYTERAMELLKMNDDTVGYITIDGTEVNYPILQLPGDSENGHSYYLDHDFYFNSSDEAAIFMDYRDIFGYDESLQSDTVILYGHNMANETMFGSIDIYRSDYSFCQQNPYIKLSSNYVDYTYKVFGFFVTSGGADASFKYWNYIDFATQEEFDEYVATVKSKSAVDIDVDVEYGDKILVLSTCYANDDDSRFVVFARRMRENEPT